MTQLKPFLFLQRLVIVTLDGEIAFDEKFHLGVNIIRGQNSSGKSTIANFIFYVLGGDHYKWTDAANDTREIFAQINANGAAITLKRPVTRAASQPMSIYWGTYDDAIRSNFEGWNHYPYRETAGKESFTNALFNALELPKFRSESDSKITMHQLLRLIFIDQDSPSQNLFRFERFDQPLTRQTVSEVLLGVYDDELYRERLQVREMERILGEKQLEMKSITQVFDSGGKSSDLKKLRKEISNAEKSLLEIDSQISVVKARQTVTLPKNSKPAIVKLQEELQSVKKQLTEITSTIRTSEIDIYDSEQFVESLSSRIVALKDSARTKQVLGELPLGFCPQCFRPLMEHDSSIGCVLCKKPFEENFEITFAKRLQQEIQLQIKESLSLLEKKRRQLIDLNAQRTPLLERYRILQRSVDEENNRSSSTRDQKLDQLLVQKGGIQTTLIFLSEKVESLELLNVLAKEIKDLQHQILDLRQSISSRTESQESNLSAALKEIEAITLELLKRDLNRQREFAVGTSVEVDFHGDVFSLDGHYNFSASSNVLLKNSVRFAIFFASLRLPFFRFPRLIISDNMEDKGMEPERAQNFQNVIVNMSQSYSVDHQIIFTTSMISDDLNVPEFVIGDAFSGGNKSLRTVAR